MRSCRQMGPKIVPSSGNRRGDIGAGIFFKMGYLPRDIFFKTCTDTIARPFNPFPACPENRCGCSVYLR